MSAPAGRRPATQQVVWVMHPEAAQDLALLLGTLEDFLRQASHEVVTELACYHLARPADPSAWGDWAADRLGDAAVSLHRLTTTTTTGEPR